MAVSQRTSLILALTEEGIVPYNLKLEEGGIPHFIMPQVSISPNSVQGALNGLDTV
jgi:hypothetical protein